MAAIYLVLCVGISAAKKENVLSNATILIDMILFITIYFSLLMLILPIFRRYYTAKTCTAFWMVPVVLYFQPYMLSKFALPPAIVIYIPERFLSVFVGIWITGFAVIFIMKVISHIRFSRKLQENSHQIGDIALWEKWNKMKKDMGLPLVIGLRYCICDTNSAYCRDEIKKYDNLSSGTQLY